ncbi:thioesterase family protein [Ornithinimicrobium faecis]|uniref:Thioesterase family protein n=1 Tax=Ornithinimicrobium faecis TaxID=2934158 RepID=A0ABY4YTB0_9MICO|nr:MULTISPECIES: thioesterase family protein [unclassified Ornithinimicrobium]USQ80002.1 thioesterase family protein [Ornithinimicrobium sp. HY1793]
MAYFEPVSATSFRATEHVSGAWNITEQHIAPALGLLAHAVEADRDARRDDDLIIGRLSYDILGTLPVDVVDCSVTVLRPGRTIELVEARLSHGGRDGVILRAWLMRPGDTSALAGTPLPTIPAPEAMPTWDATTVWPGGFIASAEVRRDQVEPGRGAFWVRSDQPLLEGVPVSGLAHTVRLLDISNGMTVRAQPQEVAFPNIDLTAHFFAQPQGDWVGFDTSVSFGASGVGLTSSVLHDETGPVGTMAQILTVRP